MKIKISNIAVSNLKDTGGFLDKQDPSVKITINGVSRETERSVVHRLTYCYFKYVHLCLGLLKILFNFYSISFIRMKDAGVSAKFPEEFEIELGSDGIEAMVIFS